MVAPCRLLVFGHLVLGEQEYAHAAQLEIDAAQKRFTSGRSREASGASAIRTAVYHLVTSTPQIIEAIGSDELLGVDRKLGTGAYATLQTAATNELVFAVVGSLDDPGQAHRLARRDMPVGSMTRRCRLRHFPTGVGSLETAASRVRNPMPRPARSM